MLLVVSCAGCGTVGNFTEGWQGRTKPYGGVKIAVNGIAEEHDVALTYTWPFRMADVALSAIGDTLMLPVTLPIAGIHAINDGIRDYHLPKEKPKPSPDDPPGHLTPERVHGGIL
jgi:uncharacterized protein YceK